MELHEEFRLYKAYKVFTNTLEKIKQYNEDIGVIDIPEFCKPEEDKLTTLADLYTTKIINDGRLDEEFNKLFR
jgi:hypothetical protein